MTGIDNHWDASEPASDYAVVMDQVIMSMQNVWPVEPQLFGHLPGGAEMWARRFLKGSHTDTPCSRLCSDSPRVHQAIYCWHMACRKLAISEVDSQPLKTAHIEIIDKLYDLHTFQ
jgi:hypothetical protein